MRPSCVTTSTLALDFCTRPGAMMTSARRKIYQRCPGQHSLVRHTNEGKQNHLKESDYEHTDEV
jgi:hypothetical protein